MRNLTKTLAVVSVLAPISAQPLGIGELKLHSALNQKLNAEIKLIVSAGEKPSDIRVRLAPPEKFDEAGVPWSYFLSQIKFKTVVQRNGSVVVKLSSNEALQEPFLDFLLEVSWDKGNLYREFTVLIDPPAAYNQPVIPVVQIAQKKQAIQKENVAEVNTVAEKQKPMATVETNPVATVETNNVSSFGPTTRRDTLWKIAEKVRPADDVSIEQMMMAIYEANHRAFYKKNVNALKSGYELEIPDQDVVLKISKRQAARLFKQHNKSWEAPVKVAQAQEKPALEVEKKVESQLELVAPVESTVTDKVVVTASPEVAAETAETQGTSEAKEDATENQTTDNSNTAANLELQARLEKLEKQLAMMQKLLVLKDEQLVALQNQRKPVDTTQAGLTQQTQNKKVEETVQPTSKAEVKPKSIVSDKANAKIVAKPKPKPKPKPKLAVTEEAESGFFTQAYYLIVGGLGVALLSVLGWFWWRKRKVEEQTDTESMFASSSEIKMPDSEMDVSVAAMEDSSAYDVGTVGESSFLSEFTPSDFDAFDTDQNEVDPISEADVYLAYGRYQQAEELIRQAIQDQPDRNECKLKLLEIFYANENKEAFEQYTSELVQAGMQKDQSFWAKVLDMANEIIPGSAVLEGGESVKANFESETVRDEPDQPQPEKEDSSLETADFNADEVSEPDAEEHLSGMAELNLEDNDPDGLDLDFDLNAFENTDSEPAESDQEVGKIEFDLGDDLIAPIQNDAVDESTDELSDNQTSDEAIETIDFDFTTDDLESETDEKAELNTGTADKGEENLEAFDFSSLETAVESHDDSTDKPDSDDSFDFNFDFDDASLSEDDKSEQEALGVSDLTDMDEFETKIDLAKAYVDMGDAESAKAIAEEVVEKGNDQQKQMAQALLDDLS